ncbi:MAG: hypothetical protein H6679_03830 [Epsilonproteobacteria bacterium]|nr:hypothetical protein [Campylobacterota bacterium]
MFFRSLFVVFVTIFLQTLDAASIIAKTSISYNTTPIVFANGDSVAGFVYFQDGFSVPSTGTMTLGTAGEVNGKIDLNNGTIVLTDDLYLGSSAEITGTGFIVGNGHTIHLSGPLIITSRVKLRNNAQETRIKVNGNGNAIEFRNFGVLDMDVGPAQPKVFVDYMDLTLKNLNADFAGNLGSFAQRGADTVLSFENCKLFGAETPALAGGSFSFSLNADITIRGLVEFAATGASTPFFSKSALGKMRIEPFSTLRLDKNVFFLFGISSGAGISGPIFESRESILALDNCNFQSANGSPDPIILERGTMVIDGLVALSKNGLPDWVFGDGVSEDGDIDVIVNPGSEIRMKFFTGNRLIYNNSK